ncbi:retropepsin-like aspartic protease family protein [Parasulfitobacter algicola]|uniref:TIGR02281 family clan AA aspartic protease n=1 Tax=Parasulfitobacter algicola TaxID=2614809 RepID=A0ABX2IW58_9RHOB|nr:TIGR02281 family clan AA aspartic protease [Sulfitobacter algicola]NSX55300.1 TIGR02281 family clan AA aspartic protease [Sulfitobacter algicola]
MTGDDTARLIYLVLLGAVIGGSFLMQSRGQMSKTAQQAAIWGLIFIGVIAAVGLWDDISNDVSPRQSLTQDGTILVPQSSDGHYYLTLRLNDVPVDFVVDTGATDMVLTQADAERIGIDTENLSYFGRARTANGLVETAQIRVDQVQLENISDQSVSTSVNRGDMDMSLLGMTYLNRFNTLSFSNGQLTLSR